MFVELIEQLRCPVAHSESQLVAAATRTEARHILEGVLGCPACGAEYPIRGGLVRFAEGLRPAGPQSFSDFDAMRLASFLELTDASGFAILCGKWGSLALQMGQISQTPIVLLNAPSGLEIDVAGRLLVGEVSPFRVSSARALALDEHASAALAQSLADSVRPRGRVVGPTDFPPPAGLRELARDSRLWVAEKNVAPDRAPRLTPITRSKR